jgi:DNA polymerase I-like protein with 3'-5' exonuclease and polymerase domains
MRIVSLDFETSIGTTIQGPTFRDPNNDVYTQIWGYSEDNICVIHESEGFKRKLAFGLDTVDLIIGHNIGFDLAYVWNDKSFRDFILRGGKIWDTQVAEYLLTGQQHAFSSLAELQIKHLKEKSKPSRISYLYDRGIGADKIVRAKDRCTRLWKLYEEYCYSDGVTPLQIYNKQMTLARQEGMVSIIELYNDYLLSIINMTCTGINIDVSKCEKTLQGFNEQHLLHLHKAQEILKKYWTDPRLPEFNINSPDHKSAVLFGGNIKITEREQIGRYKNGNPRFKNVIKYVWVDGFRVPSSISSPSKKPGLYSTDDGTMRKIERKTKNPLLKEYCGLQKEAMMYKKAAKTYCQAFLDRSVEGILHVNFNNVNTVTGRLSSSKPNLQNVSKRNKFAKPLHSLFVAPEGWLCVQIDFNQLEIWVLALLSADEVLIDRLLSGIDMHVIRLQYYNEDKTYDELFHLCKTLKDPYWHKQRDNAKTLSYQKAYGGGVKRVALETGMDEDVVRLIFKKEDETYTKAADFSRIVRESIETTKRISRGIDIPAVQKGKNKECSKVSNGLELCPIFDKSGNVSYTNNEPRMVGYYQSILSQKWHFLDKISHSKYGLKREFKYTESMNYPMQGTAATIQGATTAKLLKVLLNKGDRIKMINEVHDSKWFYVRKDVLEPCLKWLKEVIEDVPSIFLERFGVEVPFKFPIEIEVGPNFGEMEKYDVGGN